MIIISSRYLHEMHYCFVWTVLGLDPVSDRRDRSVSSDHLEAQPPFFSCSATSTWSCLYLRHPCSSFYYGNGYHQLICRFNCALTTLKMDFEPHLDVNSLKMAYLIPMLGQVNQLLDLDQVSFEPYRFWLGHSIYQYSYDVLQSQHTFTFSPCHLSLVDCKRGD